MQAVSLCPFPLVIKKQQYFSPRFYIDFAQFLLFSYIEYIEDYVKA